MGGVAPASPRRPRRSTTAPCRINFVSMCLFPSITAPNPRRQRQPASGNRQDSAMSFPIGKVKLLYVKSKVYVHPSRSSADNMPGLLYLATEQGATNRDIIVGWAPENSIADEDTPVYSRVDMDGPYAQGFVKRPPMAGSFAFQVTVAQLFSIQHRPPSLGWWYGSLIFNTRIQSDHLPVLFFHDDESPSTIKQESANSKNFNPFGDGNELFWGGIQFLDELKAYCDLQKSTLEPSIMLVNPTLEELNNFSPTNVANGIDKKTDFDFKKILNTARWNMLETLAKVTKFTRDRVNTALDDSPEPIRVLLKNPDVQRVNDEFDTARVYLAKWAMGVQEDAERSRKQIILDLDSREKLSKELGLNFDKLLPEEILNAHERKREVSKAVWDSFFDHTGSLSITSHEVKDRIFHGGVNPSIRGEVWLFLLGVYPWDSSYSERKDIRMVLKKQYQEMKNLWKPKLEHREDEYFHDQKFRIEKDIQRTDRTMEIYKNDDDGGGDPSMRSRPEDGEDVSLIKNQHLRILREILLTFNEYNDKLGYVQGMTDLLSPLYVTLQDDSLAFWSFVKFMDRMERNFLSDQSGMKDQMSTLNELVQFMLPDLYIHLEKCDSNNLFFFFRMLLVWYKREFCWDDSLRLWEILWTDFYSSQFHLFVALAILQKNEKIVIDHLRQFDEVLKYFNDLSMTYKLDDLLTRAELLFLKFRKMVEIMDKDDAKSPISDHLRLLLSKELVIKRELERHQG